MNTQEVIVKLLEDLLEQARAGDLRALVIGTVDEAWKGSFIEAYDDARITREERPSIAAQMLRLHRDSIVQSRCSGLSEEECKVLEQDRVIQ
jgi:hypothetical protein